MVAVGIDFGTSNTGIAVCKDGVTRMLKYEQSGLKSLGSYIYFPPNNATDPVIGLPGKDLFYRDEVKGRLIRGIKRALPRKSIARIKIYKHTYTLEDLIAFILRGVVQLLDTNDLLDKNTQIFAGRPSVFSDERMDNELALERLRKAYALVGLDYVTFVEEPVAAAWFYRAELKPDSTVLFVDAGGGTTDFSLVTYHGTSKDQFVLHGTGGLPVAGQSVDGDIVYEKIGPYLGRDIEYETYPGKTGNLSKNFYSAIRDPDEIMRYIKPRTFMEISYARHRSNQPEPFQNLEYIFNHRLSTYLLDQAESAKVELSDDIEKAPIAIDKVPFPFSTDLKREELSQIAQPSLSAIHNSLTQFLEDHAAHRDKIGFVVLTGGLSKSPIIKQLIQKSLPDAVYLTKSTDCITQGLAQWGS